MRGWDRRGRKERSRMSSSGHQCEQQGLVQPGPLRSREDASNAVHLKDRWLLPRPTEWGDHWLSCIPRLQLHAGQEGFYRIREGPKADIRKMTKWVWVPQKGPPQLQLKPGVGRREMTWAPKASATLSCSLLMLRSVGRAPKQWHLRPSVVYRESGLSVFLYSLQYTPTAS